MPCHKVIALSSFTCVFKIAKPQEFDLINMILSRLKDGLLNATFHSEHILHNVTAFNKTCISLISKECYYSLKDHSEKNVNSEIFFNMLFFLTQMKLQVVPNAKLVFYLEQ